MSLVDVAKELILENGRSVTFKKLSRTPADTAKPWRITGTTADPDISTIAVAVLIGFKRSEIDGQIVKNGDMKALVAPVTGVDLTEYNVLIDGSVEWSIKNVELIKPGTTEFLYKIQLRHE